MDNVIDIETAEKIEKLSFIVVLRTGHNGLEQRSSFGLFDSIEEAKEFREIITEGSSFICDVVPFNYKEEYEEYANDR
jgi:hypothetical protein